MSHREPVYPNVHPSVFIAENAIIRGNVTLGPQVSVWFGVIIRAEHEPITIGARTNVQDGTIIHISTDHPTIIGEDITIGHGAVIQGCTIEDGALIGIQATVLDGAHVGSGAIVGAGALVPPGTEVPAGTLALGVPADIVGDVDVEQAAYIKQATQAYLEYQEAYRREVYRGPGESRHGGV